MARRTASASPHDAPSAALSRALGGDRLALRASALAAEHAPDAQLALAFLAKLAENSRDELDRALAGDALARDLIFCLGASELAGSALGAAGARWFERFERARAASADSILHSIQFDRPDSSDAKDAAAALADFKSRLFFDIGVADLLDHVTVLDTARLMSALADECIRAACALAARIMGARTAGGGFCVLAMGKLGSRELNLSSDIDLVYLYEHDSPEAATRMGELVTALLSDGSFRVDLRLRPGGRYAPLVTSLDNALGFYQNLGETWERAALLRARPVGGAVELGGRLLDELGRFIYRRYLDFETLGQLRAMKRQVEAELRSTGEVARNIKLGYGGIRELEFIVHSLVLIYGGRDARLRVEGIVPALERLAALGYLPAPRAHALIDAYLFLRDVEHKLQVAAGLQTHSLPEDPSEMRALAARMGFGKGGDSMAHLLAELGRHRDLVATQFRETLAGGEQERTPEVSAAAAAAWNAGHELAESAPHLGALGFANPGESAGHLQLLVRGPSSAPASGRRRELIERLGPVLLDEIRALPDPDLALMNLAAFIAAVGARTSFLALLEQHPATRRVLLRLFASSRYLSALFIRHPDLLDTLVRSDLARPRRTLADLRAELSSMLAASADFEARLDALRAFRHQEFLRIAIADLGGELELGDVEVELTDLAEAVLGEALTWARDGVAARFKIPAALKMCAIAMGRLGAGEMSYNSDLDLIFVYDDRTETAASGRESAARIAQRLIAILESRTREGYAYKLDLRLRPSGNAGPLVTSLDGFREYHRTGAAVWERQALVRARVVAGDAELAAQVEAAREELVFGRGLDEAGVQEIAAMRARMEREIGAEDKTRLNLKQGPGGLVDIEFIAQMMALRHGREHRELRATRNTLGLLRALGRLGLIAADDAAALEMHYRFLARLENRLRIESDQAAWALPVAHDALLPLARRMGFEGADGPERLLAELKERRTSVRAIFDRVFAAEQSAN
jgi:[glutamine synthetase] adenylyltransferase / [glutamine synthetase]-adenylyl-L-tyrosine phosphorylase